MKVDYNSELLSKVNDMHKFQLQLTDHQFYEIH